MKTKTIKGQELKRRKMRKTSTTLTSQSIMMTMKVVTNISKRYQKCISKIELEVGTTLLAMNIFDIILS